MLEILINVLASAPCEYLTAEYHPGDSQPPVPYGTHAGSSLESHYTITGRVDEPLVAWYACSFIPSIDCQDQAKTSIMNRRDFLKLTGCATACAALTPSLLASAGRTPVSSAVISQGTPFLELQGGPFRDSCDGLCDYADVSFESAGRDIIQHRMPAKWRERFVLGIDV